VIVGIDAASTDLSIAILEGDGTVVAEEGWSSERRQSAELLPRLLALLDGCGRELGALTAIGVGTGPGSFTGLRVSMALAKGLAVALERPIFGVPSLAAWLDAEPGAAAAVARAGAREAYVLARGTAEPLVLSADAVRERLGDTPVVAAVELAEAFGLGAAASPRGATAIAASAARRLAGDPAGDPIATLDPIYLRAPRGIAADVGGAAPWR
jgi:tRNA threonylcarbamoyl adenosine modification protein YeaZ